MNFLKSGFGSRNMIRCMKTHSLGRNCRHVAQSKQFLDFLHPCKPYPTPTNNERVQMRFTWGAKWKKRKKTVGGRQLKDRYRNCQKLIGLCFWKSQIYTMDWAESCKNIQLPSSVYKSDCIFQKCWSSSTLFKKKYLYLINNNLINHWNWWH